MPRWGFVGAFCLNFGKLNTNPALRDDSANFDLGRCFVRQQLNIYNENIYNF